MNSLILTDKQAKYVQTWLIIWTILIFWLFWYLISSLSWSSDLTYRVFWTDKNKMCQSYILTDAFKIDSLNYSKDIINNVKWSFDFKNMWCYFYISDDNHLFSVKEKDVKYYLDDYIIIRYKEIKNNINTNKLSDIDNLILSEKDFIEDLLEKELTLTWTTN